MMEDISNDISYKSGALSCISTFENAAAAASTSNYGSSRPHAAGGLLRFSNKIEGFMRQRNCGSADRKTPFSCRSGRQLAPNWTATTDSCSSQDSTVTTKLNEYGLRCRTYFQGLGQLIAASPSMVVIPVLLLITMLVAGELGVWAAARRYSREVRQEASATARFAAQQIEFVLQGQQAPVVAFATTIKQNPDIRELNQHLQPTMASLLRQLDLVNNTLRFNLYPWGVQSGVYPPTARNLAILNFNSMDSPMYANLIRIGSATALDYVSRGRDLSVVNDPFRLSDYDTGLAFVSFLWIPVPDASEAAAVEAISARCNNKTAAAANANATADPWGFDQPFRAPYAPNISMGNLTDPVCRSCGAACAPKRINGTLYRYWGYCESIVLTSQIISVLHQLDRSDEEASYEYVLYRVNDILVRNATYLADMNKDFAFQQAAAADVRALGLVVFGSGGDAPEVLNRQPECAPVVSDLLGVVWNLCIVSHAGWTVRWELPLQIMVAVCALIVAVLDFALMVSLERHRTLVRAMLPEKAIRRLTAGRTYAQPFKSITILFSDIVSYTNLSSELTPQELVHMLNMLYLQFDALVDRHQLYKVETIGDAFMCVGGAPEPCHPRDAAARVARMALDMIDCVRDFRALAGGRRIQIRVGMYTGDVVAAVMGKKMPHWCLVGDTVNVSSRMESSSRAMSVQVGEPTADLLRGCEEFHLEARGAVDIKGKGRMFTYWLTRAHDCPKLPLTVQPDTSTAAGAPGQVGLSTIGSADDGSQGRGRGSSGVGRCSRDAHCRGPASGDEGRGSGDACRRNSGGGRVASGAYGLGAIDVDSRGSGSAVAGVEPARLVSMMNTLPEETPAGSDSQEQLLRPNAEQQRQQLQLQLLLQDRHSQCRDQYSQSHQHERRSRHSARQRFLGEQEQERGQGQGQTQGQTQGKERQGRRQSAELPRQQEQEEEQQQREQQQEQHRQPDRQQRRGEDPPMWALSTETAGTPLLHPATPTPCIEVTLLASQDA